MNKRTFIKTSFFAGAGTLLMGNKSIQAMSASAIPVDEPGPNLFLQPPLPYAFNAMEPYIDAQTMEIHYTKHHAAYTKNLNNALAAANIKTGNIIDIFSNISKYPAAVRNNGGGYYNHILFWESLSPSSEKEPGKTMATLINKEFGSFSQFQEQFSKAAAGVFGSGWTWLVNSNGKLQINTTHNQDNTLMDNSPVKGTPILCLDVWEHAYYLKYQNRRAEYIAAFWNVVNWKKAEERLII
jgi:superoxide dismutase, Fe-Mn family